MSPVQESAIQKSNPATNTQNQKAVECLRKENVLLFPHPNWNEMEWVCTNTGPAHWWIQFEPLMHVPPLAWFWHLCHSYTLVNMSSTCQHVNMILEVQGFGRRKLASRGAGMEKPRRASGIGQCDVFLSCKSQCNCCVASQSAGGFSVMCDLKGWCIGWWSKNQRKQGIV